MTVDVGVATELALFKAVEKPYGDGHLAVQAIRGADLRLPAGWFVVVPGPRTEC